MRERATSAPISECRIWSVLELARRCVVIVAASLEMLLPAFARDRHLHDLRGALVDRGDADVAPDLLDHVLVRVAVAAERLDRGVCRGVAGLRREVLGDRALGAQRALAGVDPRGGLLDRSASRPRDGPRAARSACACSPASRTADRRPGSARANTGSLDRGPPSPRRARTPRPSAVCSRTPPAPGLSPWPSTPPTTRSIGTRTSSRNSAAVLLKRMPCLSSGSPRVSPGASPSITNHVGPPGRERQHGDRVGDAAVGDPLLGAAQPGTRSRPRPRAPA